MSRVETDQNLLFGLIAMQSDLIDMRQFVDACTLWGARKESPLADILVEQGWLVDDDKKHVDYLLRRRIQKAGGDVKKSLAGMPGELRGALEVVADKDIRDSLAASLGPARIMPTVQISPSNTPSERITRRGLHSTGGIGHVWLAHDKVLDREIALKELKADQSGSELNRQRFFREAQITAQLTHPGTVPVYDFGDEEGRSYYTMKFVSGRTLSETIEEYHTWRKQEGNGGVSSRLIQLLGQFASICNTIAFAHSRRIIHRDLKPENVIIGEFGEVVVLDWGLAKRLEESADSVDATIAQLDQTLAGEDPDAQTASQTLQGDKLGTPVYMSPEQARGEIHRIDERTDVYGLAAILYEILTGQPPFTGKSVTEVLGAVIYEEPVAPGERSEDVPVELEAVCLRGLSKEREDRQQTAKELAHAVQSWIAERADRKRTEQERERFFNLSLDLLTIVDEDGCLTQTNPAWETVLGWPLDELEGRAVWELIDPADHERARENHAKILSGESLTELEYRCVCKDGSQRWILWNAKLIPGESSVYLVGRDITERRQAAQVFQDLLDATPDATVVVDPERRIVHVNAQVARLFGYGRDELLGQEIELLVPERFRAGHPAQFATFANSPDFRPMGTGLELFGRRKDGTEFPVEISLSSFETHEGRRFISTIRDITERKKAEEAFQRLLDATPDAMVVADPERRIVQVNEQVLRLFGYGRDELLGGEVELLVPNRYRSKHPELFAGYAEAPDFRPMGSGLQLFGRRKDGSEFPVEISLSSFETHQGRRLISTIRDITERIRARNKLEALLDSAPDAMVVVDLERRIQIVNSQTERMFGFERAELIGSPIEVLIPERFREGHPEKFASYARDAQVRPMASGLRLVGLRKDGSEFPVEISLSPVETEDGLLISSAIRDVSERIR